VESVQASITGIDFTGVRLKLEMDVFNPHSFLIHAVPVQVGIAVKGKEIFKSDTAVESSLLPNQTSTVSLPLKLAYADLAKLDKDVSSASQVDYLAYGALKTHIFGTPVEIPFSRSGTLPILRPPVLSTVKVQLADVSLTKARVIADAEIENPNVFDLGIKDLTFAMNLGSAQITGLKPDGETATVTAGKRDRIILTGELSAGSGLINVLMNGVSGHPELAASGYLQTPYGEIKL